MSLKELALAVLSGRVVVGKVVPELGIVDTLVPCLALAESGRKVAWAEASDRAAPYRVRSVRAFEVLALEVGWRVVLDQGFPPVAMDFRPAVAEETEQWNQAQHDTEWADERITAELQEALAAVGPAVEPDLKPFTVVRWTELVSGELHPAGAMAVALDGTGLLVDHFPGHDDDAEFWRSRFTQAGKDTLPTLNSLAGRTTMFSPPFTARGADVEDALERALFDFAKEHYAETGRTLY